MGSRKDSYILAMMDFRTFRRLLVAPQLLRRVSRTATKKFEFGSYEQRILSSAVERPNYAYCVYHSASLAKRLGYERISVMEFGVAGGNGLLSLERHSSEVAKIIGIEIDVYGFDLGDGLPEPVDYRDLPYHWQEGFYKMDVEALESRLEKATLVLGDVTTTAQHFVEKYEPAPIAAISFDLDFHSSTLAALQMLDAGPENFLPRVFCYFDDTIGSEAELYNDFTGQRLAINDFNESHELIKLAQPAHLVAQPSLETWRHQIWIGHFFAHADYNTFVSTPDRNLPLSAGDEQR